MAPPPARPAPERLDIAPQLPLLQPLRWLALGWRDFAACPSPGLIHGTAVAFVGAALMWVARGYFWWSVGAFSGFLLVAPVLATGLYAVSRAMQHGRRASMTTALSAWRPRDHRLVLFGLLLALAGTGWMLTSASLITVFASGPVRTPMDFVQRVVLAGEGLLFEAWLALGALLAAPVFASSVVAIPLLLDRPIGVLGAVLASWRCVMEHPLTLAVWAGLIMLLTGAAMLPAMLGLVIVVPWLAHASWHAYRDLIPAPPGAGLPQA